MSMRLLAPTSSTTGRFAPGSPCRYLESDSLFSVYWPEDILAETMYHLRRDHPDWPGHRTRAVNDKIRAVFEGGRVEDLVPDGSFIGPDPHDQHAHAPALACRPGSLLTPDSRF